MDKILNVPDMFLDGRIIVYLYNSVPARSLETIFSEGLSVLPGDAVHRITRIRNTDDAMRACFGELLCRIGISESFGIPWVKIVLRDGIHGKPLYAGEEKVWFSITHSGHWIGCAVARSPVGLDIERIRLLQPALPRRVLSPSEYEYFTSFSEDNQPFIFIRQWCLKESFLKAKGTGLATRWRSVSIRLQEGTPVLESPLLPFPVRFMELDMNPDYRFALCVFGAMNTVQTMLISPEELRLKLQSLISSHKS